MADEFLPELQFPGLDKAIPAVQLLIDTVTPGGASHDAHCIVKAAWVVAGFAAGQVVHHPQPVTLNGTVVSVSNMSDAAKLSLLQDARQRMTTVAAPEAVGAFPWGMLVDLAYQILKQWLSGQ